MEAIQITCRNNRSIIIPKDELIRICDDDWFLKIMIEADYLQKENENYNIWEDYDVVMSILESLRYNSLIVLKNVSLDYLLKLAEKWCVPEWLLNDIKGRIYDEKQNIINKKSYKLKFIEENILFTCKICGTGFKLGENTKTSCKSHKSQFSALTHKFDCCGKDENGPCCVQGYHVPIEDINYKIKEYKEILDDIPNACCSDIDSEVDEKYTILE